MTTTAQGEMPQVGYLSREETQKPSSSTEIDASCVHLLRLPSELLDKIVGFLCTRDIMTVAQTCRRMHSICYDPMVFQKLIRKHAAHADHISKFSPTGCASTFEELLRLHIPQMSQENDPSLAVQLWARFSAASERLPFLRDQTLAFMPKEDADQGGFHSSTEVDDFAAIVGLVVTMIVLGHPFVFPLALIAFSHGEKSFVAYTNVRHLIIEPPPPEVTDAQTFELQMAFAIAVAALQPGYSPRLGDDAVAALLEQVHSSNKLEGFSYHNTVTQDRWYARMHAVRVQATATLALLMYQRARLRDLPSLERLGFLEGQLEADANEADGDGPERPQLSPILPVPVFRNVPAIQSVEGHPQQPLFPPQWPTWIDWYGRRVLQIASTIGDPEDGEWYGYYSYGLGSHFDPPMESIQFRRVARPSSSDSPTPSSLVADVPTMSTQQQGPSNCQSLLALNCTDRVGSFDFTGEVNLRSGDVKLVKRYLGRHSWDYVGMVTPFGICGRWGRLSGTGPAAGYFWLWKKEWMD